MDDLFEFLTPLRIALVGLIAIVLLVVLGLLPAYHKIGTVVDLVPHGSYDTMLIAWQDGEKQQVTLSWDLIHKGDVCDFRFSVLGSILSENCTQ